MGGIVITGIVVIDCALRLSVIALSTVGVRPYIGESKICFKAKKLGGIDDNQKSKETDYEHSTIELTRDLLDYEEFKFVEIDKRSILLANESLKIWTL